jgi:hypothetical protein
VISGSGSLRVAAVSGKLWGELGNGSRFRWTPDPNHRGAALELRKNDRVKHGSKPEWGLGQVLEDSADGKVRVFFTGAGERNLVLKHAPLVRVSGDEAKHPGLDNLKTISSRKRKSYKSLQLLKDKFCAQFPGGFSGAAYAQTERDYKVSAHELMRELLNKDACAELLLSGNHAEICKRALKIVAKTNLVFPNEKMALKDGLKSAKAQTLFSKTLFSLIHEEGEPEQRFTAFANCLLEIGAAKWTIATYYLFFADPENQMFLKPTVTQEAADVCAFELNYRPELTWLTYKSVLEFSKYLMEQLADLKPKDMIDVQSFIWCIAQD